MTVRVGVEGAAKGLDRAQLGKAIGQGLQRGITQVAIESAAQKAGVDPLTSALTSRAITGALEGMLTSGPGVGNKAGGAMKGIFDAYTNATLNTLSLGGAPEAGNPYSQAVYASKVKDFSDIVRSRGLPQALETYATGIFMRDSLDSIVRSGDEFGKQVQEKLKKGEYKKVPLKDGSIGKAVDLPATRPTNIDKAKSAAISNASKGGALGEEYKGLGEAISGVDYALIFDAQDNLMGIKEGARYRQGKFGVIEGTDKVALKDGTDVRAIDERTITQSEVSGAKPTKMDVKLGNGLDGVKYDTELTILPAEAGIVNFDNEWNLTDGIIIDKKNKAGVKIENGVVTEYRTIKSPSISEESLKIDPNLNNKLKEQGIKEILNIKFLLPKVLGGVAQYKDVTIEKGYLTDDTTWTEGFYTKQVASKPLQRLGDAGRVLTATFFGIDMLKLAIDGKVSPEQAEVIVKTETYGTLGNIVVTGTGTTIGAAAGRFLGPIGGPIGAVVGPIIGGFIGGVSSGIIAKRRIDEIKKNIYERKEIVR